MRELRVEMKVPKKEKRKKVPVGDIKEPRSGYLLRTASILFPTLCIPTKSGIKAAGAWRHLHIL